MKVNDMKYYLYPYRIEYLTRASQITGEASRTKVIDRALRCLIALHDNRSEFIDGISGATAKAAIGEDLYLIWNKAEAPK